MDPLVRTVTVVGGVPALVTTVDQAVAGFLRRVSLAQEPVPHRFVNAYSLALSDKDVEYRRLLCGPGVNYADGKPLALLLGVKSVPDLAEQVPGPVFFERSLDYGRRAGIRHFLLGSDAETLEKLVREIELRYPGVRLAGSLSPPFRAMTNEEQREQDELILESGADVVWVALGTPKQDFEADRIWRATGLNVAAVGAAFDFLAGTKPRAPEWVSRVGLEWLFRLATEPRRLWRRYLFGNARFVRMVLRDLWMR